MLALTIKQTAKIVQFQPRIISVRQRVFSLGNTLAAKMNRSQAFKIAWKFVKIRTRARYSCVMVEFTKKSGEIRRAFVTTNMQTIPKKAHPKGTGRSGTAFYWKCYDVINQRWISFHAKQIIL